MDYPLWNLPIGGGVLIGIVAIAHVLVSHFAVGGGLALAVLETAAVRRRDAAMRALARRTSLLLILISTVFGAISGVGIWVTIGLVHPAATSALVHTFVWGWAIEWAFFIVEVATALAYYATWERVRPRTHLLLIWSYAAAAYLSLVVIQGIVSFMLTPGRWIETRSIFDGLFNPTYFPGLALRTGACLLLAGSYMIFAALREKDPAARALLVRLLAGLEVVGVLLAYAGYRWWESALPAAVRAAFLGTAALLPTLVATRHLLLWALAAALALAAFAFAVPKAQRWPVGALALLAAFAFLGGYERLREGARKPFVIRDHMFTNGILVGEIADLNVRGVLSKAAWAGRGVEEHGADAVARGRAVYRAQCSACHTLDGYLSMRKILGRFDADALPTVLATMREDGDAYAAARSAGARAPAIGRLNYPFMPPLVGTDQEADALAKYLASLKGARPEDLARER